MHIMYVKGETLSEHTGRHDAGVAKREERTCYDCHELKVYINTSPPLIWRTLVVVSVAHDPCA